MRFNIIKKRSVSNNIVRKTKEDKAQMELNNSNFTSSANMSRFFYENILFGIKINYFTPIV